MSSKEKYDSMTIEVNTPDGVLYYTICEQNNKPIKVISTFGKAGTSLSAWANAVDRLVNMLLENGANINDIITAIFEISGGTPLRHSTGVKVNSGPAGLAIALMEYKRQKFHEANIRLLESGS